MLTLPYSPTNSDCSANLRAIFSRIGATGGGIQLMPVPYVFASPVVFPPGVRFVGEGASSRIIFPHDLGPGAVGISVDPRATQDSAVNFEDFAITGPAFRSQDTPLGVAQAQMDAFQPGSCSIVRNVAVTGGFRAGYVIRWDHVTCYNPRSNSNLYNIYFADHPLSKGNHIFIGCWFDGPLLASIAVAGDNCIDGCEFVGGHLGFGPYGILRPPGDSVVGMMSGSSFDGTSFEAIGNGAIVDRSTGAGSGSDTINNCDIRQVGFMWANGADQPYRLASEPADFAIVGRNIQGLRYFGGSYPFVAGAVGVLDASVRAEADWDCGHGGLPAMLVAGPNAKFASDTKLRVVCEGTDCIAQPMLTVGTPVAGQIAVMNGGWYTVEPYTGASLPGGPRKPFAGVYLSGANGGVAVLATSGVVQALCDPLAFAGYPLYPSLNGPWLSPAVNGSPVAVAQGPQQSGGVGMTTVRVG